MRAPRRGVTALALFIFSITLLVFARVATHSFLTWDDSDAITDNVDFRPPQARGLEAIWMHPRTGYHGLYVPLTYTVWWAVAHVAQGSAGLKAPPFHAANLLFHAGAAVMGFLVLLRLVKSRAPAALGALLFAVHPIQTEAVSWASTMYTPLSGLLSLTAAWLYLNFSDSHDGQRPWQRWAVYIVATVCFALALLAKPTVLVMPLIVAVMETVLRRKPIRHCAPLLAWIVLGAADAWITREIHTGQYTYHPPIWARPLVATDALSFYMTKLVAPVNLVTDYGRSPLWVLSHRSVWPLSLIALAVIAAAVLLRRRAPWITAGVAMFVLGPAAMLGMVPFNFQHFSTVSDRYAYLAVFGAAALVAYAARVAQARKWKPLFPAAGVLLLVMAVMSYRQTRYWRDTQTLFAHNLEVVPTSVAANGNLAELLFSDPDPAARLRVMEHLEFVISEHPDDAGIRAAVGERLYRDGKFQEAAGWYREATQIVPNSAYLHYMLGRCLMEAHDRDGAIAAFTRAIHVTPDYLDADLRLGDLLADAGRTAQAAERYQAILRLHPQAQFVRDRLQKLERHASVDPG